MTLQSVERESARPSRLTKDVRPMFRRGRKMYGIYLPSLSGRLDSPRLEAAYQKYSHRQRQKSVILVNMFDLLIKIVQLVMIVVLRDQLTLETPQIIVLSLACAINLVLSILPCYSRCCANNYLHWGALATWLVLTTQGCYSVSECEWVIPTFYGDIDSESSEIFSVSLIENSLREDKYNTNIMRHFCDPLLRWFAKKNFGDSSLSIRSFAFITDLNLSKIKIFKLFKMCQQYIDWLFFLFFSFFYDYIILNISNLFTDKTWQKKKYSINGNIMCLGYLWWNLNLQNIERSFRNRWKVVVCRRENIENIENSLIRPNPITDCMWNKPKCLFTTALYQCELGRD